MQETSTDEEFRKELSEDEIQCLLEVRKKAPELTEPFSDRFLARFIFARKLDVDRSIELLTNHIKWRKKYKIDEFDVDELKNIMGCGLNVWVPGKVDKQGIPVTYIFPRLFSNMHDDFYDMKKYIWSAYYFVDNLHDYDVTFSREGYMIVEDFEGASLGDFFKMMNPKKAGTDFDMKEAMAAIENCIPARVRQILIVDPPWFVRLLTAFIRPFVKAKLLKKVVMIKRKDLLDYISEENLLKEYGGTVEFDSQKWSDELLENRPFLSEGKYMQDKYFPNGGAPNGKAKKKSAKKRKKAKKTKTTTSAKSKSKSKVGK
eukprot:TRINITY_DN2567_c0_g1_i1.p1 TRINITY_DN2567_c0_g1~~TRINITY_DN2567_c0_g1_i1.p1  ORF type:complete len:316 (+),score=73.53 TRINITY_DN2567_c0_g1_i1:51-998(+)